MNTIRALPSNRSLLFYSCCCLLLAFGILNFSSTLTKAKKALPSEITSAPTGEFATSRPQLDHDSWRFKEGVPDMIDSVAQTKDGYLWLATANGLFRFDGSRFERYRPPLGTELISPNVSAVFGPSSGGLWIGYRFGGFSFLKDGRLTNYTAQAAKVGTVRNFVQDHDGIVWAATSNGVRKFEGSEWRQLGVESNGPKIVERIALDRAGYLWALDVKSLVYLAPGTQRFEVAEEDLSAAGYSTVGFICDADGFLVTSQSWRPRNAPGNNAPPAYPLLTDYYFGLVDRAGGLWIGYSKLTHLWLQGSAEETLKAAQAKLTKVQPADHTKTSIVPGDSTRIENFDVDPSSQTALVDHEGNIWFAGTEGIDRFFYKPFVQPALSFLVGAPGIVSDGDGGIWAGGLVSPLFHVKSEAKEIPFTREWMLNTGYLAPDNTFWLADGSSGLWHETSSKVRPAGETEKWAKVRNALFEYTRHKWDFIALPPEVADRASYLQAITQDGKNGLWVSLGFKLYRYADGIWTVNGGRKDFPKTGVISEFTDSSGRVWFGFAQNQLAVLEGDNLRAFGPNDGLATGNVLVVAGRGPDVWIGGELALERYFNGRLITIKAVDDEMIRGISGIIERANGDVWLNGITGVFHISQAEVSKALQDPTHRVTGEHFGAREGLPGYAAQLRPLPSAVEGTDGRLWFSVTNGVVWLDPNNSHHPATTPPISIQSVFADDKYYDLGAPLRFPAHTSNVEIKYVAVRLSDPESVRYRYQLQEADKDWREVRAAEPVTFRNLPPGSYRFVVATSDTNGVWSDQVSSVEFTIAPAFYQTIWFRLAMIAAGLLLVFGLYRLRLRQATARLNVRFDDRLAERTRIARELHDTLLQTVQGSKLLADDALDKADDAAHTKRALKRLSNWLGQATQEGRAALNSLRTATTETNDLAAGLRRATEECLRDKSMDVELSVTGGSRDMHPIARDEIYRIAYEAIRNACEHSSASKLEVFLSYARDLTLCVKDNGAGIDTTVLTGGKAGHFGLQGMRERAKRIESKFTLVSSPNAGTEMTLIVPGGIVFRKPTASRFERIKSFLGRSSEASDRSAPG